MASAGAAVVGSCSPYGKRVHGGRDDRTGRRARQADEIALVGGGGGLDVEAREAHGGGRHVDEAGGPSEPLQRPQTPGERQDRRGEPERHHVGKGIELHAERARRVREPRDQPVQRVEHHRDADEQGCRVEVGAGRVDDARVAAEQVGHREQRRQQEHTPPEASRLVVASALRHVTEHPPAPAPPARFRRRQRADRPRRAAARRWGEKRPSVIRTSSGRCAHPATAAALPRSGRRSGAPGCRRPAGRRPCARRDRPTLRSARCRWPPRRTRAGTCRGDSRCA